MRNVIMFLLLLCVVVSCAQTRTVRTEIYKDRRTGIFLRKVVGSEGQSVVNGFSHPASFEPDNVKYMLRSLRYQEKTLFGWSDIRPVFTADEIYRLTPHLISAFAKATPDDEVIFHITAAKPGFVFSSEKYTDGSMFMKGKEVNILFGNVNIRPDLTEAYDGNPRNNYAGSFWRLVKNDWQRFEEGKKGTHYNWVALDSERALEEKKRRDELVRKQRMRRRVLEQQRERELRGWEDWEQDDAVVWE